MSHTVQPRTFHYGWVIVPIAALAMTATLPGRSFGLGLISERLINDEPLGLTRVTYSTLNFWATLAGSLFCLPCGWLIDRIGLRLTLMGTVAALAASVLGMTHVVGWWPLLVAVTLTRGFGQSALSVVSISMVSKWFPRRSGPAMAVYSIILTIGFAVIFETAKHNLGQDWRGLWSAIGWGLIGFLAVAMFVRDPDSRANTGEESSREAAERDTGKTLREALSTPIFWVFALSVGLIALIGAGQFLFNESILTEQGFSTEDYQTSMAVLFLIGLLCQFPVGFATQYLRLNWLLAFALALLAGSMFWLPRIHTKAELYAFVAVSALSGALTTILFFSVWGQAYGQRHVGKIQGAAQMLSVFGSAIGPPIFAQTFEQTKSYAPAFDGLACVVLILMIAALLIRVPKPGNQ